MTYSILGTGNMAGFLLRRLSGCGHSCAGIWGRNRDKALALALAWNVPVYGELAAVNDGPDICFLALSDDALEEVAAQLSFRSTLLVHLSGTAGLGLLERGAAHCGALWPVFSILKNDPIAHNNFPVVWEGNGTTARRMLAALAVDIGNNGYEASTGQRRALHLAAVFANNFTNYLCGVAQDICGTEQLPTALLSPILQQTLERAQRLPARSVQTGPARRGDSKTLDAQRALLAGHSDWLHVYNALSAAIGAQAGNNEQ